MKLIKPSTEILTPINGEDILKQIELAARSCYKSEDKIEYDDYIPLLTNKDEHALPIIENAAKSARVLIPKLMNLNHEAMLEFGGMITVRFIVDRGVSHELVRHRIASFAQESTRYCNYCKGMNISFILPNFLNTDNLAKTDISGEYDIENKHNSDYNPCLADTPEETWFWNMSRAEDDYLTLIQDGWTPQQARSVLPNSLKTEINVSANIREWRHIFKLRTAKAAHSQMRELMCPLLDEFKKRIPILFDDIIV